MTLEQQMLKDAYANPIEYLTEIARSNGENTLAYMNALAIAQQCDQVKMRQKNKQSIKFPW